MFQILKLIPIDLPSRVLPSYQSTSWQKFDTCIDIPVIEKKFLVDPRVNSPFHIRVPKAPEISIPLFTPGWEEIEPEVSKIPRDPRKRKKEIKATTQNSTPPPPPDLLSYEDLPSTSSHKSSLFPGLLKPIEQLLANPENNNLEGGEIPVSPVYSNEYWEPDLEIDLNSPVKLETLPVFGRPLPKRPDQSVVLLGTSASHHFLRGKIVLSHLLF